MVFARMLSKRQREAGVKEGMEIGHKRGVEEGVVIGREQGVEEGRRLEREAQAAEIRRLNAALQAMEGKSGDSEGELPLDGDDEDER